MTKPFSPNEMVELARALRWPPGCPEFGVVHGGRLDASPGQVQVHDRHLRMLAGGDAAPGTERVTADGQCVEHRRQGHVDVPGAVEVAADGAVGGLHEPVVFAIAIDGELRFSAGPHEVHGEAFATPSSLVISSYDAENASCSSFAAAMIRPYALMRAPLA